MPSSDFESPIATQINPNKEEVSDYEQEPEIMEKDEGIDEHFNDDFCSELTESLIQYFNISVTQAEFDDIGGALYALLNNSQFIREPGYVNSVTLSEAEYLKESFVHTNKEVQDDLLQEFKAKNQDDLLKEYNKMKNEVENEDGEISIEEAYKKLYNILKHYGFVITVYYNGEYSINGKLFNIEKGSHRILSVNKAFESGCFTHFETTHLYFKTPFPQYAQIYIANQSMLVGVGPIMEMEKGDWLIEANGRYHVYSRLQALNDQVYISNPEPNRMSSPHLYPETLCSQAAMMYAVKQFSRYTQENKKLKDQFSTKLFKKFAGLELQGEPGFRYYEILSEDDAIPEIVEKVLYSCNLKGSDGQVLSVRIYETGHVLTTNSQGECSIWYDKRQSLQVKSKADFKEQFDQAFNAVMYYDQFRIFALENKYINLIVRQGNHINFCIQGTLDVLNSDKVYVKLKTSNLNSRANLFTITHEQFTEFLESKDKAKLYLNLKTEFDFSTDINDLLQDQDANRKLWSSKQKSKDLELYEVCTVGYYKAIKAQEDFVLCNGFDLEMVVRANDWLLYNSEKQTLKVISNTTSISLELFDQQGRKLMGRDRYYVEDQLPIQNLSLSLLQNQGDSHPNKKSKQEKPLQIVN